MTGSVSEDYIQNIMNIAYAKWQNHESVEGRGWDFVDFVANLDRLGAAAVTIGKLHQQTCNGGFAQWLDNGYAKGMAGDIVTAELRAMAAEGSETAAKLVEWVTDAIEAFKVYDDPYSSCGEDSDPWESFYHTVSAFDDQYYDLIDEAIWFVEVAAYLKKVEADPHYRPSGPVAPPKLKVEVKRGDNVFAIIGAVRRTIRQVYDPATAATFQKRAVASSSYEDVLALTREYVNLVQVS